MEVSNSDKKESEKTMTLIEALEENGVAETYFDNYTVSVREEESDLADVLTLSIGVGGMPPHFQQDFKTIAEVEACIANETFLPSGLEWEAVDAE